MDKKEFYEKVDAIVRTAIAARIEAQTALDGVEEKIKDHRKYSVEHINSVLVPQRREMQRKIRDVADLAKVKIEKLTAAYIAELQAENHLDGGALTEDAQLLSVGVKLRDIDLERMFDKHAGNFTMQRLIADYAEQNGIRIMRTVHTPNSDLIQNVKAIPGVAEKCMNWHTKPDFYEQFMGENSNIAQYMNG